jgi:regulator of sigma E protease
VALIIFILALIMFVLLVVVHELGHAIMARRNGVEVEEFGIGFPPRISGKKLKNGTLLSINWLPLGGFVKLKGENDDATGAGTYGGTSLKNKAKILLAGVVINWLTAVVIFTLLALVGMPKLVDNQFTIASDTSVAKQQVVVEVVGKDSPASRAGLAPGDQLLSINGQQITSAGQVKQITSQRAGQTVQIMYSHKKQQIQKSAALNRDNSGGKGFLGVTPIERTTLRSTWSAPIVGAGLTAQLTGLTFQGLGNALGNLVVGLAQVINPSNYVRQEGHAHLQTASSNVSGPVGIFVLLKEVSADGLALVLYLIAVISLTLAVMNVLPIPALDGGRLFVTLVYRGLKKPLTKEAEEKIHGYGFVALLLLIALITVVDVRRYF